MSTRPPQKAAKKATKKAAKATKAALPLNAKTLGIAMPTGTKAEFAATEAGCLDRETAENLVFSCTGFGAVDVDSKLGDLFPSPVVRRGFCGCVLVKGRASGVNLPTVPCDPTNTVEDVIEVLTC